MTPTRRGRRHAGAPRRSARRAAGSRETGVSVGTVSRVISGARVIRPATRQLVESAMEHLGYEPNRVARSLRGSSTRTVAIGVHDLTSSFHTEILRGAEDVLNDLGYSVLMGNSAADQARAKRNLEAFLGQRVDGTILTTFVVGIEREVALLGEEVNGARPAPTGPTGPTTRSHRGEKPPIS